MSSTLMSSLFRPWAAENCSHISVSATATLNSSDHLKVPSLQTLTPQIHQDSTVSTTTLTSDNNDVSITKHNHLQSSSNDSRHHPAGTLNGDKVTTKTEEKTLKKSSKSPHDLLEKRHQKRHSLKWRKSLNHVSLDVKTVSNEINTQTLSGTHPYGWQSHKSTNISSGVSSAFHPQIPSNKNLNSIEVSEINPSRISQNLVENLRIEPQILEQLPYGCSSADLSYVSQYCCPDVNVELLSSELALESALLRGVLPSPAQMEEYARLLQIQENNLKGANRKQRPKKYRCPHCQVAFSNNGQLKGHVRIHTGERPYKCDVTACAKTFTRNEELTRHKRIHSGLRPYACTTCGKRFGRKDHLKKHARTHQPQYHRQALMVPFLPAMGHPYPYLYGM